MKKLILLLLLPLALQSQFYKDIVGIESVNTFKKVVIENNYQFSKEDGGWIFYGYGLEEKDDEVLASKWGGYSSEDGGWYFQFYDKNNIAYDYGYEYYEITDSIKENCKYFDITEDEWGKEFVTYKCTDAKWGDLGMIGFNVLNDSGVIKFLPNKQTKE